METISGVTYLQMLDDNEIELQLLSGDDDIEIHHGTLDNVIVDQGNNTFTVSIQPLDE